MASRTQPGAGPQSSVRSSGATRGKRRVEPNRSARVHFLRPRACLRRGLRYRLRGAWLRVCSAWERSALGRLVAGGRALRHNRPPLPWQITAFVLACATQDFYLLFFRPMPHGLGDHLQRPHLLPIALGLAGALALPFLCCRQRWAAGMALLIGALQVLVLWRVASVSFLLGLWLLTHRSLSGWWWPPRPDGAPSVGVGGTARNVAYRR